MSQTGETINTVSGKNIKLVYYPGCNISTEAYGYEMSGSVVLGKLGYELVTPPSLSCCGIAMESINKYTGLVLAARNLALIEAACIENSSELEVLTLCTGCRKTLSEAVHVLEQNPDLASKVNDTLAKEELHYNGPVKVHHIIGFLHDVVGPGRLKELVQIEFTGLKMAAHYGCHALRPGDINPQDDPENPTKMETMIELTGASTEYHPERLDCCGGPWLLKDDACAYTLGGNKLAALDRRGFQAVVTACPTCEKIFENQKIAGDTVGNRVSIGVLYLTQLLGLAFGLEPNVLGFQTNMSDNSKLLAKCRSIDTEGGE